MKLGDALHTIWQNSHSSNIHRGIAYAISVSDEPNIRTLVLSLNDLRAIWEYLNQDVPLEGTTKEAISCEIAKYISER